MLLRTLTIYLLSLCSMGTSTKQLGCIANAIFVSNDTQTTQDGFSFLQCKCRQQFDQYAGFNYFFQNATCVLFANFTSDYVLKATNTTKFCFTNVPNGKHFRTEKTDSPSSFRFVVTTTSTTKTATSATASSTRATTAANGPSAGGGSAGSQTVFTV